MSFSEDEMMVSVTTFIRGSKEKCLKSIDRWEKEHAQMRRRVSAVSVREYSGC
jgi:hypothetical protein